MSRRKRVVAPERSISIEGGGAIMPIPKGDWSADQSLTVQLTMAESNMLAWLAKRAGVTRAELIEDFVADLCASWRSGGSDERECAFAWFKRRGYAGHVAQATARQWREDEEAGSE